MYFDFSKFNYELIPKDKREEYIKRDKEAYAEILRNWVKEDLNNIIDRKWEIKDIALVKGTSDFVKLLKEAETLYELGFFTSCIALIGVCAEDFSKYLAQQFNKKNLAELGQFKRLKSLLGSGLITSEIYEQLNDIRKARNNCLHYDMDFKKKDDNQLKQEALKVLNQFKTVMVLFLGFDEDINWDEFTQLINEVNMEDKFIKGFGDISYKLRNAMSRLLDIDITIEPGVEDMVIRSTYRILEVDLEYDENGEITIQDLNNGMPVVVDLGYKDKEKFLDLGLVEGDIIEAKMRSKVSSLGQTGEWAFLELRKIGSPHNI